MEIIFNGKTYTKFQKLWNDVHFSWGEGHKTHYSAGMIYCCDHVGNLYRMYEKDFHDDGYKLEAILAIDKDDNLDDWLEYYKDKADNFTIFPSRPTTSAKI